MIYKKINGEELQKELKKLDINADFSIAACDKILESYDNKEMSYDLLREIKLKFFECTCLFDFTLALGKEAWELYCDFRAYQNRKVYDKYIQYIKEKTEIFVRLGHTHWLIKLS